MLVKNNIIYMVHQSDRVVHPLVATLEDSFGSPLSHTKKCREMLTNIFFCDIIITSDRVVHPLVATLGDSCGGPLSLYM